MSFSKRFFQIINRLAPGEPSLPEKRAQLLSRLNPDKFYVENVRSILGISYPSALRICETAVRQGLFERRVEVKCPDGVVAASADTESHLPPVVRCWHIEDGHLEPEMVPTGTLEKTTFYRLNEETDYLTYGQTA